MSGLPTGNDIAVYGYIASGTGVYGDNHDGYGVYGRIATFFGVVGMGNSDRGVGVAGVSDTGVGMQAQSGGGGVPFQIVARDEPMTVSGNLQPGMMYTDEDGNLYIWAKGSSSTFGWRKVTVV